MNSNSAPSVVASLLLVAVIVAAAGGLAWLVLKAPQPLGTFAAAGIGFVVSKVYESWKESRSRLYEKKREVYQQLLEPYLRLTLSSITKEDAAALGASLAPEVVRTTFQAIMYGSDDVLRRLNDLRDEAQKPEVQGVHLLVHIGRLLRAVRKDLGNSLTVLSEAEILSLFVNMTPEERAQLQAGVRQRPVSRH